MRPRSVLLVAKLLALLAGCAAEPAPHVVLVTFDTARFDRFGFHGDAAARTPVADALAARGLVFERAYASTPLTLPSHATLLTGVDPRVHGVRDNGRYRVPVEARTLAERLGAAGYQTAAFVSAFVLDPRFGLDQGFTTYGAEVREAAGPLAFQIPERPAGEVTDEALAWLEDRVGNLPFFIWVHYYDPHRPHRPPPPFDGMQDPYAGEIAYADAELGRLLEGVARAAGGREALVVLTSDHGEGFGAHGEVSHGLLAYDSTLHVPLVLAGPGVPAGARSDVFARLLDVVPTLLDVLGLAADDALPGRSLLAAAAQGTRADEEVVGWFETHGAHHALGWAVIEGVRTGRWKYTGTPEPEELYDVRADPGETRNLVEAEPAVRGHMSALFREARAEATGGGPRRLGPEERERLAALGYVAASRRFAPGEQPDPRVFARAHAWVERARQLAAMGRYAESIEALEVLAQSDSVRALALRSLAPIYAQLGRTDEAVRAFRDYAALTNADEAWLSLARVLLDARRHEEALAALGAIASPSTGVGVLRARVLARMGLGADAGAVLEKTFPGTEGQAVRLRERALWILDGAPLEDGEARLRALLASAPDDAVLRSRLGFYLALWGSDEQAEEALALLRPAGRAERRDPELLANLGWGAYKLGRADEAIEALEAAVALDPSRIRDRARLGFALLRGGRTERGRRELAAALAAQPGSDWADEARALLGESPEAS